LQGLAALGAQSLKENKKSTIHASNFKHIPDIWNILIIQYKKSLNLIRSWSLRQMAPPYNPFSHLGYEQDSVFCRARYGLAWIGEGKTS
jgi:hypothetical protein